MDEGLDRRNRGGSTRVYLLHTRLIFTLHQLCHDSFEEYVLPYFADKTGMHLHGINDCSGHFRIQPPAILDAFAREWGFIPTPSLELPSVHQVKSFTEEVGRSGEWSGEALEASSCARPSARPSRPPMQPRRPVPR